MISPFQVVSERARVGGRLRRWLGGRPRGKGSRGPGGGKRATRRRGRSLTGQRMAGGTGNRRTGKAGRRAGSALDAAGAFAVEAEVELRTGTPGSSLRDLRPPWTGPADLRCGTRTRETVCASGLSSMPGSRPGCPDPRGRTTSRASAIGPRVSPTLAPRDAGSATAHVATPNSPRWRAEHVRGRRAHHGRKTAPGDPIPLPRIPGSTVAGDSCPAPDTRGARPRSL